MCPILKKEAELAEEPKSKSMKTMRSKPWGNSEKGSRRIFCLTLLARLKRRKPKSPKKSPRLSFIRIRTQMSRATSFWTNLFLETGIHTSSCRRENFSKRILASTMLRAASSQEILCSRCYITWLHKGLPVPMIKDSRWCSRCFKTLWSPATASKAIAMSTAISQALDLALVMALVMVMAPALALFQDTALPSPLSSTSSKPSILAKSSSRMQDINPPKNSSPT